MITSKKATEIMKYLNKYLIVGHDMIISAETKDDIVDNFPSKFFDNVDIHLGATKLVIVPKQEDYVIKIPFNAIFDYRKEVDDFKDSFIPIDYANDDDSNYWNYCYTEIMFYEYAKDYCIEEFFMCTELLGYVRDYPIYIQEKCLINPTRIQSSNQTIKKARQLMDTKNYYNFDEDWFCQAYDYYGQKKMENLIDFCHDYTIEDFHSDNLGYYKNKPVIIDYAGYNEGI